MLSFQGIGRTNSGELRIIILTDAASIPAGYVMVDGLASSPSGYLYVVMS